ncbi:helix-turn-helix domain-containing protein [Veillonella sp.]|uniref:helix-turn-helix domain-containing protein n=1 Tax=Veillonella sp. TaxID=1926307 RepID=UPI0025EBEAE6|nr:helix-turn-helix domain-containing protein [Veillonella sp.]
MSTQFINRLKTVMAEHKISQTELAKRTGIRQSSISDWLNNKYDPKQDKVYLLANALNVSPAWLLGYDEQNPHQVQSMFTTAPADNVEGYYTDPEAAEFAEYLRTRPGARMLFSAAKDITKEEMEETVKYIEFLKSKHK